MPARDSNNWGYDILSAPVGERTSHLFLANALAFLREPRQFYIDPAAGKIYLRPENGASINGMARPNLTIQCNNAFLPASIQAQCATAGITNFQYGTSNAILPSSQVYTDRRQYRFVLGAIGGLPVMGKDWNSGASFPSSVARSI